MPKERKAAVKPAKLDVWQKRLADSDVAWKAQMTKMDRREHLYSGDRELRHSLPQGHAAAEGGRGSGGQDRALAALRAGPPAL